MIVIAAKVSVRKILACVLAAGTVLTGAAVFLPADAGEWQLRGLVTALLCYLGESIA